MVSTKYRVAEVIDRFPLESSHSCVESTEKATKLKKKSTIGTGETCKQGLLDGGNTNMAEYTQSAKTPQVSEEKKSKQKAKSILTPTTRYILRSVQIVVLSNL